MRRTDGPVHLLDRGLFKTAGVVDLAQRQLRWATGSGTLRLVLDTEHAEFVADPVPVDFESGGTDAAIRFGRPGAVIMQEQ